MRFSSRTASSTALTSRRLSRRTWRTQGFCGGSGAIRRRMRASSCWTGSRRAAHSRTSSSCAPLVRHAQQRAGVALAQPGLAQRGADARGQPQQPQPVGQRGGAQREATAPALPASGRARRGSPGRPPPRPDSADPRAGGFRPAPSARCPDRTRRARSPRRACAPAASAPAAAARRRSARSAPRRRAARAAASAGRAGGWTRPARRCRFRETSAAAGGGWGAMDFRGSRATVRSGAWHTA